MEAVKKADDPVVEMKALGPGFAHKVFNDHLDDPADAKKTYSGQDVLLVGHVWDMDRSGRKIGVDFSVVDHTSKSDNREVRSSSPRPWASANRSMGTGFWSRLDAQGRRWAA